MHIMLIFFVCVSYPCFLLIHHVHHMTWVFGFLVVSVRDDWAWYTFIILTSTQGLVIAIAFILTKKIGSLYKKSSLFIIK